MTRKAFFTIAILSFSKILSAQFIISGKLIRGSKQEISATIGLYKDSVLVQSTINDSTGYYRFNNVHSGPYKLTLSAVGFMKDEIYIKLQKDTIINFRLMIDTTVLKEVTVTATKPITEHKIDRVVFNVENSIFNKDLSSLDLLKQAPRINVSDEGVISMVGKGNVRIMINDRLLSGSTEDNILKLKSLQSDNISRIEIIPVPPSKYSAEGNSGLINIILKKNPLLGWQGGVNSEYTQRFYPSYNETGYITYKSNKLTSSINLGHNHSNIVSESDILYSPADESLNTSRYNHSIANMESVSGNTEYAIDTNLKLGGEIDYLYPKSTNDNKESNLYYSGIPLKKDSTVTSFSNTSSTRSSIGANVFLDYIFKNPTIKKMSLTYDYLLNRADLSRHVNSEILQKDGSQNSSKENLYTGDNRYRINSFFADFDLASKFAKGEAGLAYTSIENRSALETFSIVGNQTMFDPNNSSSFLYQEKTPAAYVSFTKKLSEKLTSKAGLRYEYTRLSGTSPTLNLVNKGSYGNLFPTIYLLYDFSKKQSLSFSYGKRIERPNFNDLNPFKFYYGPYSYNSGNSYLLPTISHNVEINYFPCRHFSALLYGARLLQGVSYINLYKNGINSTTPINFFNQNRLGINLSYSSSPLPLWNMNFSGNAFYNNSKSYIPELHVTNKDGYGSSIRLQNNIFTNKKKNSTLSLTYSHNFKSENGFNTTNSYGTLSANYRYTTANKRLTFLLSGYDILNQRKIIQIMNYSNSAVTTIQYPRVRNIALSINYNFGNENIKNNKREYKIEKQRAQ